MDNKLNSMYTPTQKEFHKYLELVGKLPRQEWLNLHERAKQYVIATESMTRDEMRQTFEQKGMRYLETLFLWILYKGTMHSLLNGDPPTQEDLLVQQAHQWWTKQPEYREQSSRLQQRLAQRAAARYRTK